MTSLRTGRPKKRGSILSGQRPSSSPVSRPFAGSTQPPIQRLPEAPSPKVMWPGVKLTSPFSAEVKNTGAVPPFS
jgi:hypothetical protein